MTHIGFVIRDRYRLDERIAAGGVGQVWRAEDLALRRPVAVKMLRPEYAGNDDVLARFRAEARHAGSLNHPGIAQVYDYGEAGSPYLVMELVNGPSLADLVDEGPLDAPRTADVIAQAAAALDAAHRAGVVHRDIKPPNLLFGPGQVLKITDFGIAYAIGSAPVTDLGIVVGTAAYLAPERAVGASGSPSSDLYSLGIVGYECLTGYPPFDGTQAEIMAAHLHQEFPSFPAQVPAGLADLIAWLTAKDPRARPGSAAEVAELAFGVRDAIAAGTDLPVGSQRKTPVTGQLRQRGPLRRGPLRGKRRRGLAAAAAASVTAGLAGWLVPGLFAASSLPAHARTVGTPAPSASSIATPRAVRVDAGALIGLPVNTVLSRLRALGLQPLLEWAVNGKATAGTVTGVTPAGLVTQGSQVMVVAAYRPGTRPSRSASASTGSRSSSPSPSSSPSSSSPSSPTHSPNSGVTSSPTPVPVISIGL